MVLEQLLNIFHVGLEEYTFDESILPSIGDVYKVELDHKRKQQDEDVSSLPMKKRGRKLLLGDLDSKVQCYLRKVRDGGGVVSARIVVAAAMGILLSCDKTRLVEFGRPVELNRHWAYSLLNRMNFVKRKVTTAKSKYIGSNFEEAKQSFLLR